MSFEENQKNAEYSAFADKLPRQNNYEIAFKEAVQGFLKRNIKDICDSTGARVYDDKKNKIMVPFLNREIVVTYPEVDIFYSNNEEVQLWLKILLLHYLSCIKKTPVSDEQITFKQISGGLAYYTVFQKRCITPIITLFKNNYKNF